MLYWLFMFYFIECKRLKFHTFSSNKQKSKENTQYLNALDFFNNSIGCVWCVGFEWIWVIGLDWIGLDWIRYDGIMLENWYGQTRLTHLTNRSRPLPWAPRGPHRGPHSDERPRLVRRAWASDRSTPHI